MKILCNNASLCGAVTNVSKAVSERAALKSLEGIKFKLENSMLELTGYDLEIGIKTVIPVKSDDSGEFILNAFSGDDLRRSYHIQYPCNISRGISCTT